MVSDFEKNRKNESALFLSRVNKSDELMAALFSIFYYVQIY